jgi:hypothetical protein
MGNGIDAEALLVRIVFLQLLVALEVGWGKVLPKRWRTGPECRRSRGVILDVHCARSVGGEGVGWRGGRMAARGVVAINEVLVICGSELKFRQLGALPSFAGSGLESSPLKRVTLRRKAALLG